MTIHITISTSLLGAENVLTDDPTLEKFSGDMTENDPCKPGVVAFASTVEQVQGVLRLANKHKVPVTPRVAGSNLGGISIPAPGGMLLDLTRMDRIVEVNIEDAYAVLEPGVGFGQLKKYLDDKGIAFTISYPLSPPEVSILCNCILDGLGNLSLKHGSMANWINGLEVVLPNGDLMRTGSMAAGKTWCSRPPFPDLTGLFVNWQGTTGIVTKLAVQLWPKRPLRKRFFTPAYDLASGISLMTELARTGCFDDIGCVFWSLGKLMFAGVRHFQRDPNEPELYVYVDICANTTLELSAKQAQMLNLVEEAAERGVVEEPIELDVFLKLAPDFAKMAEFPTRLDFLLDHPGGGLTWVGTYGPCSNWAKAAESGKKIMTDLGFTPYIVMRPMNGAHFAVLRFITIFDRKNPAEVQKVREMNRRLCLDALEHGFLAYKTPAWAVKLFEPHMDPNFLAVACKVRTLLDPNGIMNPRP
ncbi:MAG: FAD-binding oxidoreductase [Planctomycetota bacterium]|nr:FAD-binding oxidoreductase [Planctomycetota bacterium]